MASLQARHQGACALGKPWTTFANAHKSSGCTCRPLYHVVSALPGAKLERVPVGHDRKEAERQLTAIQASKDKGEYRPLLDITFDRWSDEWLAGLRRPK